MSATTVIPVSDNPSDAADWDDSMFLHAYRTVFGKWDRKPAVCGYKGPGPLFLPEVPLNACPICNALFNEQFNFNPKDSS